MVNDPEIAWTLGKCLIQGRNHLTFFYELCDFSQYFQVIARRFYKSNKGELMDGNFK